MLGQELTLSPRAFVFCFSAINPSQLHKSVNTSCWWELCKHDTCNWRFGESPPFCSSPSTADVVLGYVLKPFKSCYICQECISASTAFGTILLCGPYFMATQDLCDGVSDVSGVRILYLTTEGQFVPCSQKEGT